MLAAHCHGLTVSQTGKLFVLHAISDVFMLRVAVTCLGSCGVSDLFVMLCCMYCQSASGLVALYCCNVLRYMYQ